MNKLEDLQNYLSDAIKANPQWLNSDKRYMLSTKICVMKDNLNETAGQVTDNLDFFVSANSVEILEQLFNSVFIQQRYNTPATHFIFDKVDNKVVKFLSICA